MLSCTQEFHNRVQRMVDEVPIIPLIAFVQGLVFYNLYLRLQKFEQPIKSAGIDFLFGFLPFWFVIFSWTMFWGTACKLDHLPTHSAEALFSKIIHAYAGGLPLLVNAFIASVCIGIFVAFLFHAFRSVFGALWENVVRVVQRPGKVAEPQFENATGD